MTIKSSGILSLTDIQTEMGGANPIGLNEYYGGGAYTPSGIGIPTSGLIDVGSFYGKTKAAAASHNVTVNTRLISGVNYYGFSSWSITPVMGSITPTTYKIYTIYDLYWQSNTSTLQIRLNSGATALAKTYLTSLAVASLNLTGNGATTFSTNLYGVSVWQWAGVANPFPTVSAVVPVNLV